MANWERRNADTLAAAIHTHCKVHPGLEGINQRLERVQLGLATAAKTISTTVGELQSQRAQVCAICRPATLYVCDVAVGWSDSCAFVSTNAMQSVAS